MKKILLVFVLILLLASCINEQNNMFQELPTSSQSQENTTSDSPNTSIPNTDDIETTDYRIEDFLQSPETIDFVKRVSENLCGYSFDNLYDVDDISVFKTILTPEILEFANKEYEDSDREFAIYNASINDISILLEKYFGIKYLNTWGQSSIEITVMSDGDKLDWSVNSIDIEEYSENSIKYIITLENSNSNYSYVAYPTFEICSDKNGYYLKLINNTLFSNVDMPSLEDRAFSLTNQIVSIMKPDNQSGTELFDENQINNFIINLATATNEGRAFDPKSPYYREIYKSFDGYHFPIKNIQQIAHEVFGDDDISFNNLATVSTMRESPDEYVSFLEFSTHPLYSCKNISIVCEEDKIISSFILTDNISHEGESEWNVIGEYEMIFSITKNQSGEYLRFEKLIRC